jgi:hypothetical protein
MNIAIEIEQALYEQAQKEAEIEQRSIAGQIEFWARLGRTALDNPDLPISFVRDLLIAKDEERSLATPFVPQGKHSKTMIEQDFKTTEIRLCVTSNSLIN